MARSTPGTAGSKGGGNVVPSGQMGIGDNSYRGPSPFGNQRQIPPRGYTNIFTGPRQPTPPRFGGRGGSSGFMAGANTYGGQSPRFPRGGGQRSPGQTPPPSFPRGGGFGGGFGGRTPIGVPGRDFIPFNPNIPMRSSEFESPIGIPPFRRPPPSRYPGPYMPSPQNRYLPPLPRQRSPYNPPPNLYGGVRGPSGLAGFLANQPAIRQIEIDPATGFRSQNQVEKDAAEAAAAQAERDRIAQEAEAARQEEVDLKEVERQKELERQRYEPGGDMARTRPEGEKTNYQKMLEGTYVPDERARNLGYTGESIARYNVTPPSGQVVDSIAPVKMERFGGLPQPLTRDELDARFATMQAQRAAQGVDPTRSSGKGGSKGGASTVPAGSQTRQGMGGVSKGGGMGGTSMPPSGSPRIRPATGVGKATGGPVGLASLIGQY